VLAHQVALHFAVTMLINQEVPVTPIGQASVHFVV